VGKAHDRTGFREEKGEKRAKSKWWGEKNVQKAPKKKKGVFRTPKLHGGVKGPEQ